MRERVGATVGASGVEAVDAPARATPLRAGVLEAWTRAARDPGHAIMHWLTECMPASIALQVPSTGVFPDKHDEPSCAVDELYDMATDMANYKSLTEDSDADELVADMPYPKKIDQSVQVHEGPDKLFGIKAGGITVGASD